MVPKSGGEWYDEYAYHPPDILQIENRVAGFSEKEYTFRGL
jgi:hypothetical protein